MRKFMKIFLGIIFGFLITVTGCNNDQTIQDVDKNNEVNDVVEDESEDNETVATINVVIDGKNYIANLENNETVLEFLKMLPLTLHMSELNGNEKYYYLDNTLPTNFVNPENIEAGDIMLYGDDCLVIFYESFKTSYSYTKIGHIENMPHLDSNSITIQFTR